MSSYLKSCPFCGAERGFYVLWEENTPYVFCDNCKTSVSNERSDTEEQAIDAWNQRAERTCRGIFKGRHYGYDCVLDCSACGKQLTYIWRGIVVPNYCPNCGARVEGD